MADTNKISDKLSFLNFKRAIWNNFGWKHLERKASVYQNNY